MGEKSKKSGEIGETLATALLERIGWTTLMTNISIDCNTSTHLNDEGNPRHTHGEDQIFLCNNPFHDDRTDIVHVSDKNHLDRYPQVGTLKTHFKGHIKELHQTMDCAKYSPRLNEIVSSFGAKKNQSHSGLLIWLQDNLDEIEKDIKPELASTRSEVDSDDPTYLIDNARASYLLKVVDDLRQRAIGGDYNFFYPRIGTALSVDAERKGKVLPLELIAADIIPALVQKGDRQELCLYANESFEHDSYKRLVAYGLNFSAGLVSIINIGMPDYNPAQYQADAERVRLAFHHRSETVTPFSFNRSILTLLQESK